MNAARSTCVYMTSHFSHHKIILFASEIIRQSQYSSSSQDIVISADCPISRLISESLRLDQNPSSGDPPMSLATSIFDTQKHLATYLPTPRHSPSSLRSSSSESPSR